MVDKPLVVVTGSAGFIGTRLLAAMREDYRILSFDLRPPKDISDDSSHVTLDCGDPAAIERYFADFDHTIDGFINLAAYYNFNNLPSGHDDKLLGALPAWAKVFNEYRAPSAVFAQASSMATLAPVEPGEKISPRAPSLERWSYPRFKKRSEDILRHELANTHYTELVLAAAYSDFCELVPLFHYIESHRTRTIQRYFHPASLDRGLTYLHVDDCVRAFLSALQKPGGYQRFLVGEPQATTYRQITDTIDQVQFTSKIPKFIVPKWTAKMGAAMIGLATHESFYQPWMIAFADEHYAFDLGLSEKHLDWHPRKNLKQTLELMLDRANRCPDEWHQKNLARPWHVNHWTWL